MIALKTLALAFAALGLSSLTASLAHAASKNEPEKSSSGSRVFEMRTYFTHPGRLDALNARFRDHTCDLFKKHGIELVGFWTPTDEKDGSKEKLVYILAYPNRDAAKASWKAFGEDPEWKKAKAASEEDGPIVSKVESVFLNPTDYSAIK